jgi:NADPH:quinone reductase-like Zn-dependent oxidoreductase
MKAVVLTGRCQYQSVRLEAPQRHSSGNDALALPAVLGRDALREVVEIGSRVTRFQGRRA